MTHRHAFVLLLFAMLLIVAGCEQTSVAEQERVQGLATLEASTPSATPTNTATPEPSATPTLTPTQGPTPTPTITPLPSPTPLPPTPTPNPALAKFSFCNQTAGNVENGRFSAKITAISTTVEPAFERLTLTLDVPSDSVAPAALVRCLSALNDATLRGDIGANTEGYVLIMDMPGWLHDDRFSTSVATATTTLSGTQVLRSLSFRYDQNAAAGASIVLPLQEPRSFHVQLADKPTRLILDVAKTSTINASSDMLRVPAGNGATPGAPLFYVQDHDVWKFADGKPINLTNSPEAETDLAVDRANGRVAFCRVEPGADPGDVLAASTLWIMTQNGGSIGELAAAGRSCAEPVFSPDGSTIAFTVNEGTSNPPRLSIYTVPVAGGEAQRITPSDDEWSRFGPQWLDNKRLVYSALAEDGRSTLFMTDGQQERDIGANLVVGDRYTALGRPYVAPNGAAIAVEGVRAGKPGTDLVLLDGSGKETATIGDNYSNRPLTWGADGTLYYLASACASDAVLDYTLHARASGGADQIIAAGTTLGSFGAFAATNNGLAYVALDRMSPDTGTPQMFAVASPGGLWFWNVSGGSRARLVEAKSAITTLK